jgi:hypothetical protein
VKATVDRAIALERELWSGEPAARGGQSPAETASELESLIRAIVKDAACGHLGSDLRVTADEILLAEGLAIGEGGAERGATAEWDVRAEDEEPGFDDAEEPAEDDFDDTEVPEVEELDVDEDDDDQDDLAGDDDLEPALWFDDDFEASWPDPPAPAEAERVEEPQSAPGDEIVITRAQNKIYELPQREPVNEGPPFEGDDELQAPSFAHRGDFEAEPAPDEREPEPVRRLHAVPDDSPVNKLIEDSNQHRREVADRLGVLFPSPDTCEWKVPEVAYDRRRRAEVDEHTHATS